MQNKETMKPIEMREADFKREIAALQYPESIKTEFFEYWTEPNKSGTKMRFEMEKTWHLGRRLARWAGNGFNSIKNTQPQITKPAEKKTAVTDFEKVDELLGRYLSSPTSVSFEEFGQWYELMKTNQLLKTFTKEDVMNLQKIYNNDNKKCRCAAVQKTFDAYANTGLRIMDIIRMREKLSV